MRGRDVFLSSLSLHGVTKIFGNPGTTESPLLDNLSDHPDIDYIFHLHEGVAVGAANLDAQASGKTAVANMHVAPGLGNAIGMIYGALKNNSPVIVTAGAQDTRIRLRDPVLGHDLVAMAKPVTKWSVQVEHADEMAVIMQRAFKIANTHPAGPVFVALPINVMEQETNFLATGSGELLTNNNADATAIAKMADLINQAASPVIVASDDVVRANAVPALVAFAEKIGAPVHIELITGRFAFPARHPNFRGKLGPDVTAIHAALKAHDLVILLGGPFFEEIWHADGSPFANNAKVVQLEESAARLAHNLPVTLGISGNIANAIGQLTILVHDSAPRRVQVKNAHAAREQEAETRFAALKDRTPMTPARALAEVGLAIDANAVIVDESITASLDVVRSFCIGDTHDFFGGRGGGIGQGVAGCLGVAVALPDRQIVAITGDGSAMYSIQALWTAAHHNLNILFVILSNREYRVLKHNIDQYRRRFNAQSNKPYPHMDLANPVVGFTELAAGMGIPGCQIAKPEDIKAAVQASRKIPGPYLLDIIIEGMETR